MDEILLKEILYRNNKNITSVLIENIYLEIIIVANWWKDDVI